MKNQNLEDREKSALGDTRLADLLGELDDLKELCGAEAFEKAMSREAQQRIEAYRSLTAKSGNLKED